MRPLLPAVFLLLVTGCSAPLDVARATLTPIAAAYTAADARATAAEGAELARCDAVAPADAPACVEATVQRWAPTLAALETLYAAVVAGELALHLAEARAGIGAGVDLAELASVVAAGVEALGALQAVAAPKPAGKGP